jgi:Zn-dependent protease
LPNIGDIVLWFIVFLFSLSVHESAHALTSDWFGDSTGRYQGRITLNPLPHIDPIGTILFPLMSFFTGGISMFGWAKPVMTNPLLWRDKTKANIVVSAAGPISNFILAIVGFIVLKALLMSDVVVPNSGQGSRFDVVVPAITQAAYLVPLVRMISILLVLNLTLGVFNLVPIPPLDGSHVLESLLPPQIAESYAQLRPYGFLLLIAFIWLGVFTYLIRPVFQVVGFLLFGA